MINKKLLFGGVSLVLLFNSNLFAQSPSEHIENETYISAIDPYFFGDGCNEGNTNIKHSTLDRSITLTTKKFGGNSQPPNVYKQFKCHTKLNLNSLDGFKFKVTAIEIVSYTIANISDGGYTKFEYDLLLNDELISFDQKRFTRNTPTVNEKSIFINPSQKWSRCNGFDKVELKSNISAKAGALINANIKIDEIAIKYEIEAC